MSEVICSQALAGRCAGEIGPCSHADPHEPTDDCTEIPCGFPGKTGICKEVE